MVKNPPAMWEARIRSLGWEDSPRGGHSHLLQDSWLENPHGQWLFALRGAPESGTEAQRSTAQSLCISRNCLVSCAHSFPMTEDRTSGLT